jgi:hypothetical protein
MTIHLGQRVHVSSDGRDGFVVGEGKVGVDGEDLRVVVVDFKDGTGDVLPFFEGDVEVAEPEGYFVEVAYVFKAEVKAFSEFDAEQALREALIETLTWDGDEDTPEPLRELEMRSVPVPAKELA